MTVICSLCGCPEDDAYVLLDGGIACRCGVEHWGDINEEEIADGFHLVDLEDWADDGLDLDPDSPFA